MLPTLGVQRAAYEIQMSAVPAVARMELRGFRLDVAAHSRLGEDLEHKLREAETAYMDACRAHGRDDLADAGLPKTPRDKERLLETLLPQDELDAWERTPRNAALSTKRTELQRAAPDYPPIAALIEVVKLAKLAEDFGPTLAARVSSVTGRVHASYLVAGANIGPGHLQAAEPAADTAHLGDRRLPGAVRSRSGQSVGRRRLLQHGVARRRRDQRRPRP